MKRILILFSCVPQVSPLWPNLYLNPQFASVFVLLCRPACCVPCVSCITVAASSLLVTQSVPGFCLVRVKLSSWESCIGFHLLPATQCHVTVGASWYWPCFTFANSGAGLHHVFDLGPFGWFSENFTILYLPLVLSTASLRGHHSGCIHSFELVQILDQTPFLMLTLRH